MHGRVWCVLFPLCPPVAALEQTLVAPSSLPGGKGGPGSPPLTLLPRPQESISSSGTPHKRDSFIYSTWLEDSVSTTSGGSSPGTGPEGPGWALRVETPLRSPVVGASPRGHH